MSGCATPTPAGSDAMSSISEPTSAGSYTEADVCKQVAVVCTAEEVQVFREAKEAESLAALAAAGRPPASA